jgi:hypothetical protein
MNCARCGRELKNTSGVDWMDIDMLCRSCCGETEDGMPNLNGRPRRNIGMPQGSHSHGTRATKISTSVGDTAE